MNAEQEKIDQLKRMTWCPARPGELVADLLEDNPITQEEFAKRLGVSRQSVNYLIKGKRALTVDMAHRLGKYFGNGPAIWMRMQQAADLWELLHADTSKYDDVQTEIKAA